MNLYLRVLFESAWGASIIPLSSQATLYAMKYFGGYDMRLAVAMAVIGSTLGQLLNWLLGKLIARSHKPGVSEYWYDRASTSFNQYGVFLLLFCWVPLCNLLVVLAGAVNTRLRIVLPLVFVGELFHFGRDLL